MTRQPDSRARAPVSVDTVLRKVARAQASHARAVHHLIRRAEALRSPPPRPQVPSGTVQPDGPGRWSELVARIDVPHPGDLPWGRIERAASASLLSLPTGTSPRPLDADSLSWELPFQEGMGLDGLKTYQLEDNGVNRYGSGPDQLRDARALGADVLRQFGVRDLLWGMLTNQRQDAGEDDASPQWTLPVAVPLDAPELAERILRGRAFDGGGEADNVARYGELLAAAWRRGQRLLFTFLTLGGGSENTLAVEDSRAAKTMRTWEAWGHLHRPVGSWPASAPGGEPGGEDAVAALGLAPKNVLRLYWAPEHLDPVMLSRAESDPVTWAVASYALASLDFRFSFQRAAVRSIAYACAGLLVEAEAHARSLLEEEGGDATGFSLDAVVEGIELFNECEARTIVHRHFGGVSTVLAEETAAFWAKGAVAAAVGFLEGFRDRGVVDSERPQLFLPGLSSYSEADWPAWEGAGPVDSTITRTWTWRRAFLDALCRHIASSWSVLRGEGAPSSLLDLIGHAYRWLPSLADAFAGVDLHWYHFAARPDPAEPTADIGPLHAGYLASEVAEVAEIMESHGFPGRVTVFETCASEAADAFHAFPSADEDGDGSEDEALREAFQASDAWRRVLAAHVGGADKVAWHPWAEQSMRWDQCGLRDPPPDPDADASRTVTRAVYFAFHRVGLLLRDSSEVRLLLPDSLPTRSGVMMRRSDPNAPFADMPLLVFEIRGLGVRIINDRILGPLRTAAYVLMVDPTSASAGEHVVELSVDRSAGGETLAGSLWMEPFATDPEAWRVPSTVDGLLPRYRLDASIRLTETGFSGAGPVTVTLRRGDPPWVLLSPSLLTATRRL